MEQKKDTGLSNKAKYFWISVCSVGSIGIWLPMIIEVIGTGKVNFHNIPPNMATYYIAILFGGSIDYFLSKIKQGKVDGLISTFLNTILIILVSVFSIIGIAYLNIKNNDKLAFAIALIGILASWIMWWEANERNSNFDDTDNELGGNPLKPLQSAI
jgi:predicted neutral ceramidase superfamily lipid hydrolase